MEDASTFGYILQCLLWYPCREPDRYPFVWLKHFPAIAKTKFYLTLHDDIISNPGWAALYQTPDWDVVAEKLP